MSRRVSLRLAGALMAPAVLVSFVLGTMIAGVLNCGTQPASAQSGPAAPLSATVAALPADGESPFARVAEVVVPTVVNISIEKKVQGTRHGPLEPGGPLDEFFRRFMPEMPDQERNALGSGVIIDPDGYIVTNNHVVADFDRIVVRLSDDTEFTGKQVTVVGRDPKTDLAVLKVEADKPLPAIRFGDVAEIRVGNWAIAVGNAFGLRSTVTVGVVSAKGRSGIPLQEGPSYQDFIQTDASINPGNSGGALVNIRGELIGINSAIRSPVGANVGVGFAVPVDMVRSVTTQLMEHGRVIRGFLGVRPQPVTEALRDAMGLEGTEGVLLSEVLKDMPAEKAGLKAGDVIVKVDGKPVTDLEQFRRLVAEFAPGTKVSFSIIRGDKRLIKKVKLVEFPDAETVAAPVEDEPEEWFGLSVRGLSDSEAQEASVTGGVLVESVASGSAAADAGIRRGDIILELDGKGVRGVGDFGRATTGLVKGGKAVLVRLLRQGTRMFVAIEP